MKRVLLLFMIILTMSCSTDDVQERSVNESFTLVYTTQELGDVVSVYAGSEITYSDTFEFINSEYNPDTNSLTVQTEPGPVRIESNFYIENGSEVTVTLYNSVGSIITEQTFSQINYTFIHQF